MPDPGDDTPPKRRGRPPVGRRVGTSSTREAIAREARKVFADKGYDGASIRVIADGAGVNSALVGYFFGTKSELFSAVLELPVDPATVIPTLLQGPRETMGVRLAHVVLQALGDQDIRTRAMALIRSASGNNEAAEVIRRRLTADALEPLVRELGIPDAELRAAMMMTQILGFAVGRHLIGLEVLNKTETDRLAAILGATLQSYLAGSLPFAPEV